MDTGTLMTIFPWLLVVFVPAGITLYFVRQMNALRQEATRAREESGRLQTALQVRDEKLANTEETLERERQKSAEVIEQITAEKDRLKEAHEALRQEKEEVKAKLAAAEAKLPQIDALKKALTESQDALEALRREKADLEADFAAQKTRMEEERKAAREKIVLLEQAEERLGKEFENLANRIFEDKQKKFAETSKAGVETLLNPVREQLREFRKRVDEVYDQENRERASLRTEINLLKTLNERISNDAVNLTKALKGESKTRGNWGEMQLERLLEESGLTRGREYEVQVSLKSEEGKRLQPDVVVHLPEKKDVVIDSKVSLVAYEQFCSSEDEEERNSHLGRHVAALRTHFKSLSRKGYEDLIGVNSLDLVIMFVPIEPALLLAFEHEPNLFNEAFNLGVLLVCPSTLMATLQIINNIWRHEYQNRNTLEIATEAGKLYDKFVQFTEALEEVGKHIRKAGESYETAHKRLTSGRGNLVGRTQKLKALGAKTKKEIDAALLERAAAEDNEPGTALICRSRG
jgi:DNA recombination protein RmuC